MGNETKDYVHESELVYYYFGYEPQNTTVPISILYLCNKTTGFLKNHYIRNI